MKRYWVIAPYSAENPEVFDKAWNYDLKNNTIAIGWTELGDVSQFNEEELMAKIGEVYPDRSKTLILNTFLNFYHEISVGDIFIARRGRKKIIGIGEVQGKAFYDENRGRERVGSSEARPYNNFINVKWQEKVIAFDKLIFSMNTLYEISEDKYKSLIEGKIAEELGEDVKEQQEFVLEKYLEDFIVSNFKRIFGERLVLYKDNEGNGQQYPTDIGNIDILAKEPGTNSYVVIELKKGRESDKVVGQVLRYMGWVKENLVKEGENVKGLIICKERDEKLDYSLKAIPNTNIEIKLYKIDFQLVD